MRTILRLPWLALIAFAAASCDGGGDIDAGPARTDAGIDSGVRDAGRDAGPTPVFDIRLVNNVPGLWGVTDDVGAAHVCAWFLSMDRVITGSTRFLTQASGPVPFRGVSPYLEFPVIAPLDYLVGIYDPADLGEPAACPADPNDVAAPQPALLARIAPDLVPEGVFVTAVASGLATNTLGATDGALPSLCNPAMAAPTFMVPCTTAAALFVYSDDRAAPADGMTRYRATNQVANSTPPSGWTLCYDPGVVPRAPPATGCADVTPMMGDQSALAVAVTYGTMTDYADRAPILPTGAPAPGIGGALYLHLEDGRGCPAFTTGRPCYPMLAAFPPPAMGEDPLPDDIRPMLADGAVHTIFISGLLPPGAPFEADFGVKFFVWQDNLGDTP